MGQGQWGAENFSVQGLSFNNIWSLESTIKALNAKTKQAFYAAATARTIKRGTWHGCAFNAAAKDIGQEATSIVTAAKAFGCTEAVVRHFIQAWDNVKGTDDSATELLRDTLEKVGLFNEPGSEIRVVSYTVWKSEQTELLEAFQKQLEDEDFVPEGFSEANELLGV